MGNVTKCGGFSSNITLEKPLEQFTSLVSLTLTIKHLSSILAHIHDGDGNLCEKL